MGNLDYGVIGNCTISALIDARGSIVWACLPRLDGDPFFCALLDHRVPAQSGAFAIELQNHAASRSTRATPRCW
jgi:GH15 family glucan-1,4-alpha-glucosidase